MAVKKVGGSSKNGRDSTSKRLGLKVSGGALAKAGAIILRQVGCRFYPGKNTFISKNYSIHAKVKGTVSFKRQFGKKFIEVINLE